MDCATAKYFTGTKEEMKKLDDDFISGTFTPDVTMVPRNVKNVPDPPPQSKKGMY